MIALLIIVIDKFTINQSWNRNWTTQVNPCMRTATIWRTHNLFKKRFKSSRSSRMSSKKNNWTTMIISSKISKNIYRWTFLMLTGNSHSSTGSPRPGIVYEDECNWRVHWLFKYNQQKTYSSMFKLQRTLNPKFRLPHVLYFHQIRNDHNFAADFELLCPWTIFCDQW